MVDQLVTASFSLSSGEVDLASYVTLEQEGFSSKVGTTSKVKLITELSTKLYGLSLPPSMQCGLDAVGGDVSFNTIVYAYFYPAGLSFEVGLTNGVLQKGITERKRVTERIKFDLTDTAQVRYGVYKLASLEWEGDTWDSKGRVISPPTLNLTGNTVKSSAEVKGVATVEYTTMRTKYSARVTRLVLATENIFDSVAWARWDGGVDLKELDSPTGASNDTLEGTTCDNRYGGSTEITGSGSDDSKPTVRSSDITCEPAYCELEGSKESCGE